MKENNLEIETVDPFTCSRCEFYISLLHRCDGRCVSYFVKITVR